MLAPCIRACMGIALGACLHDDHEADLELLLLLLLPHAGSCHGVGAAGGEASTHPTEQHSWAVGGHRVGIGMGSCRLGTVL